jgi:hypothetical protein
MPPGIYIYIYHPHCLFDTADVLPPGRRQRHCSPHPFALAPSGRCRAGVNKAVSVDCLTRPSLAGLTAGDGCLTQRVPCPSRKCHLGRDRAWVDWSFLSVRGMRRCCGPLPTRQGVGDAKSAIDFGERQEAHRVREDRPALAALDAFAGVLEFPPVAQPPPVALPVGRGGRLALKPFCTGRRPTQR